MAYAMPGVFITAGTCSSKQRIILPGGGDQQVPLPPLGGESVRCASGHRTLNLVEMMTQVRGSHERRD
jgi:hypothetical protein